MTSNKWRMFRNRYPGKCCKCSVHVPEECGAYIRGSVYCAECEPKKQPEVATIEAVLNGRVVEFTLNGFAGREKFAAYMTAMVGTNSIKRPEGWVNVVTIEDAPGIVKAASQIEGLPLVASPEVEGAIAKVMTGKDEFRLKAVERVEELDKRLRRSGGGLFSYQRSGIPWLASRTGAVLGDDMGLGKTLQALIAAPGDAPLLVIAPAVAKGVWMRETKRWRPDLVPTVLKGRGSFRWPQVGEIVIINYDILQDEVGLPEEGTVVIFDEAHHAKNNKSARGRRCAAIAEVVREHKGRSWALTATPLLNEPGELWSMLKLAGAIPFSGFSEFATLMGGKKEWHEGAQRRIWQWDNSRIDPSIGERLQTVMLRRVKEEVLTDLPPKRHEVLEVSIKGSKRLDAWEQQIRDLADDDLPAFEELSKARALLAKLKIPALVELVKEYEDQGEPLVVFSAHREPIDTLGERKGWAVITGDTSPDKRTKIEDAFQAGKLRGVAATIDAGGVAITLTRASHMIMVDRSWTSSLNRQAEDRCYRVGQKNQVLIRNLVADHPLDRRVQQVIDRKQSMIEATVNAARVEDRVDTAVEDMGAEAAALIKRLTAARKEALALGQHAAREEDLWRAERSKRLAAKQERKWREKVARSLVARGVIEAGLVDAESPRRKPSNEVEAWAAEGVRVLAGLDGDRARHKNDVGFNAGDSSVGHLIAARVRSGLTDAEWLLTVCMLRKYHRQIGDAPELS